MLWKKKGLGHQPWCVQVLTIQTFQTVDRTSTQCDYMPFGNQSVDIITSNYSIHIVVSMNKAINMINNNVYRRWTESSDPKTILLHQAKCAWGLIWIWVWQKPVYGKDHSVTVTSYPCLVFRAAKSRLASHIHGKAQRMQWHLIDHELLCFDIIVTGHHLSSKSHILFVCSEVMLTSLAIPNFSAVIIHFSKASLCIMWSSTCTLIAAGTCVKKSAILDFEAWVNHTGRTFQ